MHEKFNVVTNTNYLVEILRKSLDDVNKCEAGVTTRKAKKDGTGEDIQMLQLSHEQFFTIFSSTLKDLVEMVGTVRTELTEEINELKQDKASLRR